jgi:anti-sigma regulatory factor (Ser/Thr protein kinase)
VRSALRQNGVPSRLVDPLVLAVAEACNNAILHAGGEAFGISVEVHGTNCTIVVTDSGEGFVPPARAEMPAPDATGRRGLALMQALVDQVEVSSNEAGTTVVLAQSLAAARTSGNGLQAAR